MQLHFISTHQEFFNNNLFSFNYSQLLIEYFLIRTYLPEKIRLTENGKPTNHSLDFGKLYKCKFMHIERTKGKTFSNLEFK